MKMSAMSFLVASLLVLDPLLAESAYDEPYRPQFHFSPPKNWMNDPNGMVWHEGEFHLFYQYNPKGDRWGHMSWGHAVSRNLLQWEHLPLALEEEDGYMMFSGSAVDDVNNTSGFGKDGKGPLVAIYTGHATGESRQNQQVAFSNDRGRTWTKYAGNPVLDINKADFRDPKVSWHDGTRSWVMTVALPTERKVQFYASRDLKQWEWLSDFGPAGATEGVWECPDLFEMPVEEDGSKWVLIVNLQGGAPAGGSGCQYFVGSFDGKTFTAEAPAPAADRVVHGKVLFDFEGTDYAGWEVTGDAFGDRPASGTLPDQQVVSGQMGSGMVNSYRGGDRATGTLLSPSFKLDGPVLSFLVGGGKHEGKTGLRLLVDGEPVRSATGRDDERLNWQSWDVAQYQGKEARVEIFDHHTEGWGHINVDHLVIVDEPVEPKETGALWADYGKDFYAAVSWSGVPGSDGRRLWLGWMTNLQYAGDVPTSPWRGSMTVPRALELRKVAGQWNLIQRPVEELKELRGSGAEVVLSHQRSVVNLSSLRDAVSGPFEMLLEIEPDDDLLLELQLRKGPDEETVLLVDVPGKTVTLDRRRSGKNDFSPHFPAVCQAPMRLVDGKLKLQVHVDRSSLEVFVNDGEKVLSSLVFPSDGSRDLGMEVKAGTLVKGSIKAWELKSIWR